MNAQLDATFQIRRLQELSIADTKLGDHPQSAHSGYQEERSYGHNKQRLLIGSSNGGQT